jgi:hypothetical protein
MLLSQSLGPADPPEQRRRFAIAWKIAMAVPTWTLRFAKDTDVDRLLAPLAS